jgi:hypothetical protein
MLSLLRTFSLLNVPNNVSNKIPGRGSASIDDAISNAQEASAANARSQRPLLSLSRLFRERALLGDTQDQYVADMQSAKNWQQQFFATGGHLDSTTAKWPLAPHFLFSGCLVANQDQLVSFCSKPIP